MSRKALASLLIPGDIIAIYAGNNTPYGSATVEEIRSDELTSAGDITLWTTDGRFDVPAGSHLDVLAWAPMPDPS
jgi:hypothetical protein